MSTAGRAPGWALESPLEEGLESAWGLQEALWRLRSSENHPGSFKYKENEELVVIL